MYFIRRRAKVARMIGLLALHTSELGENTPVSEVTFHFIFLILLMLLLICQIFTALFPAYVKRDVIQLNT